MPSSAVVRVTADQAGRIPASNGAVIHGFWFRQWREVAPPIADRLHRADGAQPFTLSPLMGLPHPDHGHVSVARGARAWFRVATLTPELSAALESAWLPSLPAAIELAGLRWQVEGVTSDSRAHSWARRAEAQALAESRLLASSPPRQWTLAFTTPTAFRGICGHLPFPLPDSLVGSWLRRWERFGPVRLPQDLRDRVREGLAVSAYDLKTVPVFDRGRLIIGCVGKMRLTALRLTRGERAAVDLLAHYAFWVGSGHHTTQGLGMTQVLPNGRGW
jgi:CRISPR-associated endoribonuclease Cas6